MNRLFRFVIRLFQLRWVIPIALLVCLRADAQDVRWATKVINYSSQKGSSSYSVNDVLGAPNSMPSKGYSATAWEAATDDRKEFLHVGFDNPMKIRQVIIAENFNPGAVVKVVLYDPEGKEYEVLRKTADTLDLLSRYTYVKTEETPFLVSAVKITVDCRATPGINQIDAIGIADHTSEVTTAIHVATDLKFDMDVEKLGPNINTVYSEVNPVISPDGQTLFLNRKNHPPHTDDDEIWYSGLSKDMDWGKAVNIGQPLNNANHNFVSSITPDGNTMLLGNQYFKDPNANGSGFSITHRTVNGWSFPENARIRNFVNTDRYVTFFLSNDGKKVLMNVRREDTRGESDLYVSFLQDDGSWSEPRSLGPEINSTGRECCAFLASDNTTLYFSSDGYNGFGSNDIYMAKRLDDSWQKWSEPLNIGPPVNSAGWDAYYTIPAKGDFAYFVRDEDIYRIKTVPETQPDPVVMVYGTVYNHKTNEPVGEATIHYEYLPQGKEAGIARSAPGTGEYKIVLPAGHHYGFLASAARYISESDHFDTHDLKAYAEIRRDLYLVPAVQGETIRINNIFFDFGKATLQPASFPELERVVKLLHENPSMIIRIEGHTDNVGAENDNLVLSKGRAAAVQAYLSEKGIDAKRMSSEGYGEQHQVTTNDTEEGRAFNRRVEFRILHE